MRKVLCGVVVLALAASIGLAEEIRAVIIKVNDGKITFAETKKGEKGAEKSLPVADNVKVLKGTFNQETKKLDAGEPIATGLKNELFTRIDDQGLRATIITDADNKKIIEIRVGGRKKN